MGYLRLLGIANALLGSLFLCWYVSLAMPALSNKPDLTYLPTNEHKRLSAAAPFTRVAPDRFFDADNFTGPSRAPFDVMLHGPTHDICQAAPVKLR